MRPVGDVIAFVLWAATIILIARIVFDWVQMLSRSWRPRGPILVLAEVIYSITDPPLRALRSVIPPIRLGMVAVDLSPLILFVMIYVLQLINSAVFY